MRINDKEFLTEPFTYLSVVFFQVKLHKQRYVKRLFLDHMPYTSREIGPDCNLEREEERPILC